MFENFFAAEKSGRDPQLALAFRMPEIRSLQLDTSYEPAATWRYLTHHIRRFPRDLRAHTQRIILATHATLHSRLAGSLQDLFLVLEDSGQVLREELFELSKPYLSGENISYFAHWLKAGFEGGQDYQWREGSVLVTGLGAKPLSLIKPQKLPSTQHYGTVLEEALDCLEYGQVDNARALLEAECLRPNHDPRVEDELLNIYQYTRDKTGLIAMMQSLQQAGIHLAPSWSEKRQDAEQW